MSDPVIEFGVKELLAELRKEVAAGFASTTAVMAGKADKVDLAEIRGELKGHNDRIASLEKERDERRVRRQAITERRAWSHWAIPVALTLVSLALAGLALVLR